MKIKNYLMLAVAVAMAACSEDDATPVNNDSSVMTLAKVTTYSPQFDGYSLMNKKYYNNNSLVADSTFNSAGTFLSKNVRTQQGNTRLITTVNASGQTTNTATYTYDSQGRIVSYDSGLHQHNYTYNTDGTITDLYKDNGIFVPVEKYTTAANGQIFKSLALAGLPLDNEEAELVYENGLPAKVQVWSDSFPEFTFLSFTYYSNPVPQNMQKSVTQLNNNTLISGQLHNIMYFGNFYIKDASALEGPIYVTQKTFNTNGYITHNKTSLAGNGDGEIFYEYNEEINP